MPFDGTISIRANSVLQYERYAATFSPSPAPRVPGFFAVNPERRAVGDYYRLRFSLRAPIEVLQDLFTNGLMREIQVADPKGKTIWSGFVYAMSFKLGPVTGDVTVQNVWNRVHMRYRVVGSTTTLRSTRIHNEISLRKYGPREYVMTGGEMESAVQPNQACRLFLAKSAYPKPSYTLNLSRGGKPEWGEPVLEITGAGWIESMASRIYNQPYTTGMQACSAQIAEIVGIPLLLSLKRDCVAWWKFEEGEGPRYEEINALHLADVNTVTGMQGKQGGCASFTPANNEYLTRSNHPLLQTGDISFAFSVWVYLTSKPAVAMVIAKDGAGAGNREYELYYQAGGVDRFRFFVCRPVDNPVIVNADALGSPALNTWYHIVVWHNSALDQIGIRINDAYQNIAATGGALQAAGTADFRFGHQQIGGCCPMAGAIDECCFLKRCFTAAEITHLYNFGWGMSYPTSGIGMFLRGSTVEVNSTLVSRLFDMDRRGLDILQDITRIGDASYRRYLATVDAERYFKYGLARIAQYAA